MVKDFKILNEIQRLRLKWTDKVAYRDYKFWLKTQRLLPFNLDHKFRDQTHFKHSGNSGDIIYSLPAVYALANNSGVHMHLQLNEKMKYTHKFHPLGDVMLNNKMVEMMQPLLLHQPQINVCDIYIDQLIDYDLDLVRKHHFDHSKNSISRWYFHIFCIFADLCQPWLMAPKNESLKDYIVIARSHRYRSPNINYEFLKKYKRKIFIGIKQEFDDMRLHLHELEYLPVNNFLEMAAIINGSRLFIGNQSLPFSIAEALKVKRVLELSYDAPNVIITGKNGYDFYYQEHFEKIVNTIMNE